MVGSCPRVAAMAFLDAYSDTGISKQLYFDVWADRFGLDAEEKSAEWGEVRRLTYVLAAEKRRVSRQRRTSSRALSSGAAEALRIG